MEAKGVSSRAGLWHLYVFGLSSQWMVSAGTWDRQQVGPSGAKDLTQPSGRKTLTSQIAQLL